MAKSICSSVFIATVLWLSTTARAENWGHWRGPTGNGNAMNAKPPIEWSNSKNIQWKVDIPGRGSSSPVIWENKVYITTAVPTDTGGKQESKSQSSPPRGGGPGQERGPAQILR